MLNEDLQQLYIYPANRVSFDRASGEKYRGQIVTSTCRRAEALKR